MVRIKDRIVLYDLDRVCDLYQEIVEIEKKFLKRRAKRRFSLLAQRKELQKEIIYRLTGIETPKKKHYRAFVQILKAAGLLGGKKGKKNAKEVMRDFVNHIGASVNKTPHEIMTGFTTDECEPYMKTIAQIRANEHIAKIKAYHMPDKFMQEVSQKLANLSIKKAQIAEGTDKPKGALSQFRSIVEKACFN